MSGDWRHQVKTGKLRVDLGRGPFVPSPSAMTRMPIVLRRRGHRLLAWDSSCVFQNSPPCWHPLYGISSVCACIGMPSMPHTGIPPCVHTLALPLSVHTLASSQCVYTLAFPRCMHHTDFSFSESRVFS